MTNHIFLLQVTMKDNLPAEAEGEQDGIMMVAMYRQGFLDRVNSVKIFGRL